MIKFPAAKINLGLNVIRKRVDGYHELRSVMIPIPLHDILEVVIDHTLPDGRVNYRRTGLPVKGEPEKDLCMRAVGSFKERRALPGMHVHLHKVIPMGAGLGGGSSDGATMLLMLNELLDARLDVELPRMAAELGSDCNFFLKDAPQLIEGKGERTIVLDNVDLSGKWLVLIDPGIHISTADIFRSFTPNGHEQNIRDIVMHPLNKWQGKLKNDLEEVAFSIHPVLSSIKTELLRYGAKYAAMSGSGSALFGIFDEEPSIQLSGVRAQWILKL